MPAHKASTPPTRRGFHFAQFKALDAASGTFSGYLAVFSSEDQGGDIIEPGAFTKTLAELANRQRQRNSRFILPIFWGHDPNEPIGGFTTAREDAYGLYVEGELDLDIEQGHRAYSGMVKGYADGMSIGYFTIKADYDRMGRRHLKELAVFEGSVTPIPMNADAVVAEVKSATGKATWPLGERDDAWDNGAAHKRIVAWATDAEGNVDSDKLKSVHFYSPTGDAVENVSAYKLLFCDVTADSVIKAMPKAIFACAGSHGVEHTDGISADEQDTIKGKISAYYRRMAREFDDKTIVAPWDAKDAKEQATEKGKSMPRMAQQRPATAGAPAASGMARKARDFSSHFQALAQSDQLQDDWADTFLAIVRCFSDLMWQAHVQANGWMSDGSDPVDIAQAAQDNLDAFSSAVSDLVDRSLAADFVPMLDDDADSFEDPDADDDDCNYMSLDTRRGSRKVGRDTKSGRMMSAANHKELGGIVTAMTKSIADMTAQHKALVEFHGALNPSTKPDAGADVTTSDDGGTASLNTTSASTKTTSHSSSQGAGLPHTDADNTTPLTADDVSALLRQRMQATALAQRVATGVARP